jgi:predicted TIM-barrel fold metal-dependent hydrolase
VSKKYWFISIDDHVVEPPNLWWDRLSKKDREVGPRVVRDSCETRRDPATLRVESVKGGDGPMMDWWIYEDLAKPIPKVVACAGIPVDEHNTDPIAYADMRPGCYDPVARIEDMDQNFMERSLCFPYVPRFAGQMFYEANDRGLALRCVQAYNDWVVDEWCAGSSGRLLPLTLIPLWDPAAAAKEMERNAARGCRAITFPEMPHFLNLPSIHDPSGYWDPVFRVANETGIVLCMHIGSGSKMADVSPYAPRAASTVMTFSMAQLSFVEWAVLGLFIRYPNLKIAYSESQIGWLPFVMERLDKCYTHTAYAELPAEMTQPPTAYLKDRVFGCFFDDETGVANRHTIGVSQMVFECDYPHQDTTWPHTNEVIAKVAEQVSPEELEMILRGNAIRMLGLDPTPIVGG